MKGYCKSCKKEVQGVKSPINWLVVFLSIITLIGIIPYMIWRLFITPRNKCPLCGLKLEKIKQNERN